MKLSREFKVGILSIISIGVFYLGFNFLKGIDFFSNTRQYYIIYDKVDGLTVSNPVKISGLAIGRVRSTKLLQDQGNRVLVEISIQSDIKVGDSTRAILTSDLLGEKGINLIIGNNTKFYEESGDTLIAQASKGVTDMIMEKTLPIVDNLDSTVIMVNRIINGPSKNSIYNIIRNLEGTSYVLKSMMVKNKVKLDTVSKNFVTFSGDLAQLKKDLDPILANLNQFSDTLSELEIKQTISQLNSVLSSTDSLMSKINNGEGTMGKLMTDESLYNQIDVTLKSLDTVITRFDQHPKFFLAPLGKKSPKKWAEVK